MKLRNGSEVARFLGIQRSYLATHRNIPLYTLTRAVGPHVEGATVSDRTLEALGYAAPSPNFSQACAPVYTFAGSVGGSHAAGVLAETGAVGLGTTAGVADNPSGSLLAARPLPGVRKTPGLLVEAGQQPGADVCARLTGSKS